MVARWLPCWLAGLPRAVTYATEAFLEKNKDYVVLEHQLLLGASGSEFLQAREAPPSNTEEKHSDGNPAQKLCRWHCLKHRQRYAE